MNIDSGSISEVDLQNLQSADLNSLYLGWKGCVATALQAEGLLLAV